VREGEREYASKKEKTRETEKASRPEREPMCVWGGGGGGGLGGVRGFGGGVIFGRAGEWRRGGVGVGGGGGGE